MNIKKINRSSLAFINSILLILILVILSYMAINGNGRYQIADGDIPLLVDTRTGTTYRLNFNGDIYYLEDGRIKKKSFFSPQKETSPTAIKKETEKEAKTRMEMVIEKWDKEIEEAKERDKQSNKRREEWN